MTDDATLRQLAESSGVATSYDGRDGRVSPPPETLRTVLTALGVLGPAGEVVAGDEQERLLPPWIVATPDTSAVGPPLPADATVDLLAEDGTRTALPHADGGGVRLPPDLASGYHVLEVAAPAGRRRTHLLLRPRHAPTPDRSWGWMLQLYAVRSRGSWGLGDLEDLRLLVEWAAGEGADFVVCNPLHLAAPTLPQQPSPYYPSSRRAWHPLYLRIERVPEHTTASAATRERIAALAERARAEGPEDRLDRDLTWTCKVEALELLWREGLTQPRAERLDAFVAERPGTLRDVAVWCALAEVHGSAWREWPAELHDPRGAGVEAAAAEHADRVRFHQWLQMLCEEQLATAQATARHAGMRIGVIHDLAVGVNPQGADAWALQDDLADGATVGAPPDDFNQQGQDWAQPPLLPNRLDESGGSVLRELLSVLLRSAGGVRIDHILGWFRTFWVPDAGPQAGTYVRSPADLLLGVLLIEADRAGAVVVGEDLGVVAPGVREAMEERRILGSRLLYFAQDDEGRRLPALDYDRWSVASVTTHDLPTAHGWWQGEGVRVQTELGLLADSEESELRRAASERASMAELLRAEGLLPGEVAGRAAEDLPADDVDDDDLVDAMHAFLARTGSVLAAVNLPDAVGDVRQPNMPGTVDEYPSWRLPLARPDDSGRSRPVDLEEIPDLPSVRRTIDAISATRAHG